MAGKQEVMMNGDSGGRQVEIVAANRITPDLVQWIITDEKVAGRWRSIAFRLGLAKFIPELDVGRRGSTHRGARRADKHRLQALFQVWEKLIPDKYNLQTLKAILAAEGLQDMWMWVNMMTQSSPVVQQVSDMIYRNIPPSPASSKMSTHSPTSGYLYSPVPGKWMPDNCGRYTPGVNGSKHGYVKRTPHHYEVHSSGSTPDSAYTTPERRAVYLNCGKTGSSNGYSNSRSPLGPQPNSPYSTFFQRLETPNQHKDNSHPSRDSPTFSNSSMYISSSRNNSSRPNSQMSDYYLGDYLSNGGVYKRGMSCPNTPIQHRTRRSSSPSGLSQTWVRTPDSRGWVRSTDFRGPPTRNNSIGGSVRSMKPRERNVFNILYRPDLIKMSSPISKCRSEELRSSRPESRTSYAETEDDTDADTTSSKVFVSKKLVIVESVEEKQVSSQNASPRKKTSPNHYSSIQNGGQNGANSRHNGGEDYEEIVPNGYMNHSGNSRQQNDGHFNGHGHVSFQNGGQQTIQNGKYGSPQKLNSCLKTTLSKDDPLFTELDEIIESCKANERSSKHIIVTSKSPEVRHVTNGGKVVASAAASKTPVKVTVQSTVINQPIQIYKPQIITFSTASPSGMTTTTSTSQPSGTHSRDIAISRQNSSESRDVAISRHNSLEQNGDYLGGGEEGNNELMRSEIRLDTVHNNSEINGDCPRKGGKNSYSEYFDNLIALIEKEVNNL